MSAGRIHVMAAHKGQDRFFFLFVPCGVAPETFAREGVRLEQEERAGLRQGGKKEAWIKEAWLQKKKKKRG